MPLQYTQKITCPHCGQVYEVQIHHLIDTNKHPEWRESVRSKEFFKGRCPFCQKAVSLDYNFMYLQDNILLHCVPDNNEFMETCRTIDDDASWPEVLQGLSHRVTHSKEELFEKLAIFDAGLDDRIIELLKVVTAASLEKQQPGFHCTEIYFATDINTSQPVHLLQFNDIKNQKSATLRFDENLIALYNSLADEYGPAIEAKHAKDVVINKDWAKEFYIEKSK